MTPVTCRLTAKNRDQLRNPMLGNRVWATFTFTFLRLLFSAYIICRCSTFIGSLAVAFRAVMLILFYFI